ncbi:MAG: hypothetical protein GF418_10495, partial [Chitinivibrionales bacterium]|nr:hypothetical protein [Chitinivibrionales bacterium]MBD3396042.1 hypothetical protein [Chitinivibrionales bacterium]
GVSDYSCVEGELCRHPEDIYIDGEFLKQVGSVSDVVPGTFYFDYDNDKVYIADNPDGHTVEISVCPYAFSSDANDVTIRNIVFEKYACPAQHAPVHVGRGASGWVVENNEMRLNHGCGLELRSRCTARNNHIHHNGQKGIGVGGDDILVEDNEIAYNRIEAVGYEWGWEAGGSKFWGTDGLVLRNNYVHHNDGPGLWTDGGNNNTLFEGNLIDSNAHAGIFHEISGAAIIRCNIIRDNGTAFDTWLWGAQIQLAAASNTEVVNNVVQVSANGGNGITIIQQDRGRFEARDCSVHHNQIICKGTGGLTGGAADHEPGLFFGEYNNMFDYNYYHVADASGMYWQWEDGEVDLDGFKAFGFEANAAIDTDIDAAYSFPDCIGERDTVSITVSRDTLSEDDPDGVTVTVSRRGQGTDPFVVRLDAGGNAGPGQDYEGVLDSVTLDAAPSSAEMKLTPVDDGVLEFNELISISVPLSLSYLSDPAENDIAIVLTDNDTLDKSSAVPLPAGSIRHFLCLHGKNDSLYVQRDGGHVLTDYLGGESTVMPHSGDKVTIGTENCTWRAATDEDGVWMDDESKSQFLNYFSIWLISDGPRNIRVMCRHDDGIALWHGDRLLLREWGWDMGEEDTTGLITLDGHARFLFKALGDGPPNMFSARFADENGEDVEGLQYMLDPVSNAQDIRSFSAPAAVTPFCIRTSGMQGAVFHVWAQGDHTISVYSLDGSLVCRFEDNHPAIHTVPGHKLVPGTYIVRFAGRAYLLSRKLVVLR